MENFMKRLLCVVLSMAILGSVDTKIICRFSSINFT
jgi:hypothetical protein